MRPFFSHRGFVAVSIVGVIGACSHKVESPKPTLAERAVSPDLVCNAQIESRVVIAGTGFTPAPVGTLDSPRRGCPRSRSSAAPISPVTPLTRRRW